ncbi:MAG: GGDEF domain-containing protein, partial [Lachnospiraceae bacterium]|nr:GGDEF domain-containing protein [Lachnospiraceae bacterium]
TGLEFSHVAGELFSKYEKDNMRGIIIDSNGYVHMDSSLMDNREFLHQDYSPPITDLINDPKVLSALNSYLDAKSEKERFDEIINIVSSSDTYRYITVSPIHNTDWSVIILSGSLAFFDRSQFLPVAIIILILLLLFAAVTSIFNYRLIFRPLNKLSISLDTLKDEMGGEIYGLKRNDEIGYLAQTINDLFNKANLDALTGIYNRRFMENNLDHTMEILKRSNSNLSVLMIDIDFFKKYNDTYGHKQGDACLKEVAGVMAATAQRTIDFAARYGGEEFIVVLPSTDENGARVIAEELLSGVRGLEIPHSGNAAAPHVTVSVGITTGKVLSGQSWGDYVKCADEALYISKNSGRNRCSFKMLGGDSAN